MQNWLGTSNLPRSLKLCEANYSGALRPQREYGALNIVFSSVFPVLAGMFR